MDHKDEKEVAMSGNHDVERHSDEKHDARRRSTIAGVLHGGDDKAIEGQMFSMHDIDPALDAKMRLVNQAINQIGWTNFHLKLFCLNGFGYMADSLILVIQSVIAGQAAAEFQPSFANGLTFASYAGMLVGALFWVGLTTSSTTTLLIQTGRQCRYHRSKVSKLTRHISLTSFRWPYRSNFCAQH